MWEINVINQIVTFALSLCLGGLLCLFYDVIRALHKAGFNSFFAVFFTDIFFWIISAFLTFIFLIARTNGEIRGYVLCGEVLGFALIRYTVSRFIFFIFSFLFLNFVKVNRFLRIKIYTLFEKVWFITLDKSKQIFQKFKSIIKSIKKLLKNKGKLLYTNKNITSAENVLYETKT